MTHRIEFIFAGNGPDNELDRAVILAGQPVRDSVTALVEALHGAGLDAQFSVKVTKSAPNRARGGRKPQMRVAGGQAESVAAE